MFKRNVKGAVTGGEIARAEGGAAVKLARS